MPRLNLSLSIKAPELIRPFVISTGARTHQPYVSVHLSDGSHTGRGAAAGLRYFDETPETMAQQIESVRREIESGTSRKDLLSILPAGGARAALDCAMWELHAAQSGVRVASLLKMTPKPLASAFTIVLDSPEAMAKQTQDESWRPLLKVKLGRPDDLEAMRMQAVAKAAPEARKVIDANAGWSVDQLKSLAPIAARLGFELLEQPLPMGSESLDASRDALIEAAKSIPLCADESFQTLDDFETVKGLYQAVNIKLEKCGGLTAALELHEEARARQMSVFVGCMLAPVIAIAPAFLLAQSADYADLDGPFWFRDEPVQLNAQGQFMPIKPDVWGQGLS